MSNPFTDVRNAIWDTLESSQAFCDLIPVGKRIKDGTRIGGLTANKGSHQEPRLRIVPDTGLFQSHINSSSSWVQHRYRLEIDQLTENPEYLEELMWVICRALSAALSNGSIVRSLQWSGANYVRDCRLIQYANQPTRTKQASAETWHVLWTFEVDMQFTTTELPYS